VVIIVLLFSLLLRTMLDNRHLIPWAEGGCKIKAFSVPPHDVTSVSEMSTQT